MSDNQPRHDCECKFCRPLMAVGKLRRKYPDDPEALELLAIIDVGIVAWYEDAFSDAMDIDLIASELGLDYKTTPRLVNRIVDDIRYLYARQLPAPTPKE